LSIMPKLGIENLYDWSSEIVSRIDEEMMLL
jgi:hypothetical protein